MKKFLGGNRVIKTGVAVLLTAWICDLLEWPAVFAVITAIVTIEPTVSDSIKKGIVRFPVSAIDSAYAVTFISQIISVLKSYKKLDVPIHSSRII